MTKDKFWSSSLPVGAEAYRIIKLVNKLSDGIFNFQLLMYLNSDYQDYYGLVDYNQVDTLPEFLNIQMKFRNIGKFSYFRTMKSE
jgi:hypothetical protein